MANQLVGAPNMAVIADLLADPMFEFHCMVDHPDNVAALGQFFAARGLRLYVMIEYGVPGGRCGCRTEEQVLALADAVQAQPALALTGIEGYEGVIHGDHAIDGIKALRRRWCAWLSTCRTRAHSLWIARLSLHPARRGTT